MVKPPPCVMAGMCQLHTEFLLQFGEICDWIHLDNKVNIGTIYAFVNRDWFNSFLPKMRAIKVIMTLQYWSMGHGL